MPTLTDFLVRACALALRRFPGFNASFVDGRIERYSRVNIGIAVAVEGALLVPVLPDADGSRCRRSRARPGRCRAHARAERSAGGALDGTFTVSNLSRFGVHSFTAIVDPPQGAILAVGGIERRPYETEAGGVGFRETLFATLSADHRLVLRGRRRPVPRPPEAAARASARAARLMPVIDFRTAVRDGLDEALAADERVVFFGEDVAAAGGVFAVTGGLLEKHGPERVFDTPISELALAGAAFGSAVTGLRPVVEIMFGDFLTLVMDSIVNQMSKYWFLTRGEVSVPVTIRSVVGAGGRFGAIHSQMPVAWLTGIPGIKIVAPSTPADAKALLRASIEDDNPVLFFEHKRLYTLQGEVDGTVRGWARRRSSAPAATSRSPPRCAASTRASRRPSCSPSRGSRPR